MRFAPLPKKNVFQSQFCEILHCKAFCARARGGWGGAVGGSHAVPHVPLMPHVNVHVTEKTETILYVSYTRFFLYITFQRELDFIVSLNILYSTRLRYTFAGPVLN